MEFISVFDVFKIGVGPSSSHTLGPWRAASRFMKKTETATLEDGDRIKVHLYGSLSLTGKGHATDLAVMMGLDGHDPETIRTDKIPEYVSNIRQSKILIHDSHKMAFDPESDIIFEQEYLDYHANGMVFKIVRGDNTIFEQTYFSVGGGFIIREGESLERYENAPVHPFPVLNGRELLNHCSKSGLSISEVVMKNELMDRSEADITSGLMRIWSVMLDSMYTGCHTHGCLPGPLKVKRRAPEISQRLLPEGTTYHDATTWMEAIRSSQPGFQDVLKWVSAFALAVNEVNASFGRVVTAPTNGSAGVIPSVLMYYLCFVNREGGQDEIIRYLYTSGEIGSIFKKGSTISAAMGGCQAEIGVSSAMAAAGLTELMGGSADQCSIAAEVAMEHHLGMTCDPIGGLVQVPCIERNSMGAVKAINAAIMSLDRNPEDVKVPLDNVIATMWETAQDMNRKYKETSEGGLATAVNVIDC